MKRLRIVTLNLWGGRGPAERRLERVLDEIGELNPHLVGLQEVYREPGRFEPDRAVAEVLGGKSVFHPVSDKPEHRNFGLAVVSRLPILDHGATTLPSNGLDDDRIALRVAVKTDCGRLVFATTHLTWGLDHEYVRRAQVLAMDRFVQESGSELPPIFCGDFNATPDADSVRFLRGLTALEGQSTFYQDAFGTLHPRELGHTWSRRNPFVKSDFYYDRRIDYIFVGPLQWNGVGEVLDARVVLDRPDRDHILPSDHFGVFAEVRIAPIHPGPCGEEVQS